MPRKLRRRKDRRRTRDVWSRILPWLMGAAWVTLLAVMLFYHRASPEFYTLFDEFYGLDLRRMWDHRFLKYLFYAIILGLFISISSIVLGVFRARRKTDRKKQIVVLAGLYMLLTFLAWRLV